MSDIGAQQYDQFGKIFTVKLQYIFYKERPGVRPGQVKKAERITNKLSQFAAYAIQGDYQGRNYQISCRLQKLNDCNNSGRLNSLYQTFQIEKKLIFHWPNIKTLKFGFMKV